MARELRRFVSKIFKILKLYGFKIKTFYWTKHFKKISTLKNNINRSKDEPKNLQISFMHETHVVDLPCLNWCLLEFTTRKLRSFLLKVLKLYDFKTFNKTFWYGVSTLQNNIYRMMKITQSRKASCSWSQKPCMIWEWSIINSKTNFVAWKSYILIVFRNEHQTSMFRFHFELQKVYLNRDRAGKKSWKFWNLTAKLNGNF